MRSTREDKRRHFRHFLVALLALCFAVAALCLIHFWEKGQGEFSAFNSEETVVKYNGKEYEKKENIETFLLLGLDTYAEATDEDAYTNDMQADYILLFVFDNDNKTTSAIQINRDTMANVNILGVAGQKVDTAVKQIAIAHTYGNGEEVSCYNVAESVSNLLLGVEVKHFLSSTIDSIAVINDLVDGVEVEVLNSFEGIDDSLIEGEVITLNGEQATNYVRSRHGLSDSTNQTRMNRQIQYMTALQKKAQYKLETDENFVIDASLAISEYIVSDRSVNQLQELANKFSEYEFLGIQTLDGELKEGEKYMEFYPAKASIEHIVASTFYTLKK